MTWQLFETLSENSLHHASACHADGAAPTLLQKKRSVYDAGTQ